MTAGGAQLRGHPAKTPPQNALDRRTRPLPRGDERLVGGWRASGKGIGCRRPGGHLASTRRGAWRSPQAAECAGAWRANKPPGRGRGSRVPSRWEPRLGQAWCRLGSLTGGHGLEAVTDGGGWASCRRCRTGAAGRPCTRSAGGRRTRRCRGGDENPRPCSRSRSLLATPPRAARHQVSTLAECWKTSETRARLTASAFEVRRRLSRLCVRFVGPGWQAGDVSVEHAQLKAFGRWVLP